jgi:hypothetical protein
MIRHRVFQLFVLLFILNNSYSQWDTIYVPLPGEVRAFSEHPNGKLYVAGHMTVNGSSQGNLNSLWEWDGQSWNNYDTIGGKIYSLEIYRDTLYVAGPFSTINGVSIPRLAKWDGNNWISFAGNINGVISKIKVIDNELLVMGNFSEIGGIQAKGIARYDGTNWHDLYGFDPGSSYNVADAVIYNNEWYAAGNFQVTVDSMYDIAVYKNSQWQRVGQLDYIRGGFTNLWCAEVYSGELYVGGLIMKSEGNVGYGIQKWNGQNWSEVGVGLKDINNTTNATMQVRQLMRYSGKLWAMGGFGYAGDEPFMGIASWDGIKWCGRNNSFNTSPMAIFYQDTLYLTAGDTINGRYLLKWQTGNDYEDYCSSALSLIQEDIPAVIDIFPNPTDGGFTLRAESPINLVRIVDISGKLIKEWRPNQKEVFVDLQVESGIYIIDAHTEQGRVQKKIIKL